jgi:ABC-2 type transport system permease protein
MRTFAEEKRSGTLELLLTKPFSDTQLIAAKFLASLTLLVIALLPTLLYVISVYNLGSPPGNIDLGSTWGSYLGLIFLGATFISIGVFASSVTSNQIVAFVMAAPLCFIMYFGFEFIYSFEILGTVGFFVKSLGIDYHYKSFSIGLIDTRDILYFVSVILIFLISTRIVLLSRKW